MNKILIGHNGEDRIHIHIMTAVHKQSISEFNCGIKTLYPEVVEILFGDELVNELVSAILNLIEKKVEENDDSNTSMSNCN